MTTRTRARLFDSTLILIASAVAFIGICSAFHPSRAHALGSQPPPGESLQLLADATPPPTSPATIATDAQPQPPKADPATPAPSQLESLFFAAVTGKKYTVALGALLLLFVAGVRKLIADDTPEPVGAIEKIRVFVHTSLGGYVAALVFGFGGSIGAVLLAGQHITLPMLEAAGALTVGTTGVFGFVRGAYQALQAYRAGNLPPGHPALEPTPAKS